tara:strand:+ start:786 stop:1097 length:312 start_codon:yes stop_codon:yes gene_type:complete
MKASDVRSKSVDELKDELLKLRKEQLNLRFQRSTGQLENVSAMRQVRKDIARVKTVMSEKNAGIEVEAPKAKKEKKTVKKPTKKTTKAKASDKKSDSKKKKTA